MKTHLLTLALFLIGVSSFSQDYATVIPGNESIYFSNSTNINEGLSSYHALKIDSAKNIAGNIIYYHYPVLRHLGNFSCYLERSPNWLGSVTVVKPNGEHVFLNKDLDSLRIKTQASLNEKWHFFDFSNGNYFEAEVTNITNENVAGTTDLTKQVTLTLKDPGENTLSHDFNGRQILLTQNYGLLKAYDFYLFPSNTEEFILKGTSSPLAGTQNLTAKEIFTYEVGDEFHIEDHSSFPPTGPAYFIKERNKVLSRTESSNHDTLIYSIERSRHTDFRNYSDPSANKITKTVEIIQEKISLSRNAFLDSLPNRIPLKNNQGDIIITTVSYLPNSAGRLSKSINRVVAENNICYSPILDDQFGRNYIEGAGGGYYNYDTYFSPVGQYHRELVYYKKGIEIWGTPIDFDLLLSVSTKSDLQITSEVFPNPFSEHTVLKIKNENKQTYQVILTDVFGKIVKEYSLSEEELTIENDGSMNGMYFYKLYNTGKDEVGSGKLIVH